MGTRADFYLGRGADAVWLGSTAYDGHPENHYWLLKATTKTEFRKVVVAHIKGSGHGTLPDQGWPWPWGDSHLTDHAYAFDDSVVYVTMYNVDADGKYTSGTETCAACGHTIDQWCKLDDVRRLAIKYTRASRAHERASVRYTEALARFDAGVRKTAPTPPPDFDDEGSAFDPPRLGPTVFPNMKDRQNVTLGPRSGVMFIKLGD